MFQRTKDHLVEVTHNHLDLLELLHKTVLVDMHLLVSKCSDLQKQSEQAEDEEDDGFSDEEWEEVEDEPTDGDEEDEQWEDEDEDEEWDDTLDEDDDPDEDEDKDEQENTADD